MAITYTSTSAKKFVKPKYIVATLFTGEETDETSPLGNSFVLEDVIRDTTSATPDENETNDIECETSDNPIMSIVTLGKYQFAAEVADTQVDLLTSLAGFVASGNVYYAPAQYTPIYAKIDIVMEEYSSGDLWAYSLLKVQLNSRLLLESLNTNPSRISLAGTGQNISVTVGGKTVLAAAAVNSAYTLPTDSAGA